MIALDGRDLTPEQVRLAAEQNAAVLLTGQAEARMRASRALIERMASRDEPVYAVNTGVGRLADKRIESGELAELQRNVVRSHACGTGELLPRAAVRGMMVIRAHVLAMGYSGIRPEVAGRLCDLLNAGVTPQVPSRGSVGASGDLAPLAHMALVLMGEGEAEFGGERLAGSEALRRAGIAPLELAEKEGISLINGTQAMLSLGCLALLEAETLCDAADVIAAMSLDALRGTPRALDPRIHAARPHPGQIHSAAVMNRLIEGSQIRESHRGCGRVQDAYSLRCAPQVHGAVRDACGEARRVMEIELNSATDNPLVFGETILSGGNFHGQPLAFQMDFLAIALSALAGISERRIDRLVNPELNEDLPPFLAARPGLESGWMMAQVTAAALVAENRVLATPASPGSITTSGNQEDFVSMGMTAALKLRQVVANTGTVLAIEALTAARALDCRRPLRTSAWLERVRESLATVCPPWRADAPLSASFQAAAEWIRSGRFRSPAA